MITPAELRKKLLSRWERGYFFREYRSCFPYEVTIPNVSAKKMTDEFDAVRKWVAAYQADGRFNQFLQWREVNHRLFGKNRIPRSLLFETPEALAGFLGRTADWNRYRDYSATLYRQDERLGEWGDRHPSPLLRIGEDLERLLRLWRWMVDHPRAGIYLRQIDLPAIDTKFTEQHKGILSEWLERTLPEEIPDRSTTRFEDRYGYRSKPELIRFRFLDETLSWRGCDDISVPSDQFCSLFREGEIPVSHVFVIENDICALSFPKVGRGMVVFGRGYHFDHWKECTWLGKVSLHYWGDIDTHGFAILDQFRSFFPHASSFLMDRETLLAHESSWGEEPKPATAALGHLTEVEASLYEELRSGSIRPRLRLEQEFISYGRVEEVVRSISS